MPKSSKAVVQASLTMGATASSLYASNEAIREPFLIRARDASLLTNPSLLPELEEQPEDCLPQLFQSVGAEGVSNLSAALLLTLLPPNEPFFSLGITQQGQEEIAEALGGSADSPEVEEIIEEIRSKLSNFEQRILKRIEKEKMRPSMGEALKQLLVAGNVVVDYGETKSEPARVFKMDSFVCERLGDGTVFRTIIKEAVPLHSLTKEELSLIGQDSNIKETENANIQEVETSNLGGNFPSGQISVNLFTVIQLINPRVVGEDPKFAVWQELETAIKEETYKEYSKEDLPIQTYWFTRNNGKNYSLGYVDQFIGDLKSLEGLSEAMVEAAAGAARNIFFVNPGGMTQLSLVQNANNLDVVPGRAEDVSQLQTEKLRDFRTIGEAINKIESRLNSAFLVTENLVRRAERVTQEEIQLLRQSIERKLGNVYANLSEELQEPLLQRIIHQMEKDKEIPDLPEGIDFVIVAGIDSLGKAQEFERHVIFLEQAKSIIGPENLNMYIKIEALLKRLASMSRINTSGLIRTTQEVNQELARQQQLQVASAIGPEIVNQGGALLRDQQLKTLEEQPTEET